MDNRKYLMIADGYLCMAIDGATICQKAEPFIKKSVKNVGERNAALSRLLKWCNTAEVGAFIIRDEFTIIVKKRNH